MSRPRTMETDDNTTNPLYGQQFNSIDDVLKALNAWGRREGVAFVKARVSNYTNYNQQRQPTRADIVCDRGGRQRPSKATTRRTSTIKTNCAWRGVARAL